MHVNDKSDLVLFVILGHLLIIRGFFLLAPSHFSGLWQLCNLRNSDVSSLVFRFGFNRNLNA